MKKVLVIVLAGGCSIAGLAQAPSNAASKPRPQLLAPGVISTGDIEFGPALEPDGQTIYFSKGSPGLKRVAWIMVSHLRNGSWTTPEIASFSGRYTDIDPTISPDGKKLFFASTRPLEGTGAEPKDLDLWVVEKSGRGWGEPRNLGAPINSPGIETTTSVTADGTLYLSSAGRTPGRAGRRLYRARLVGGAYQEPEALPAPVDGGEEDSNQYVSPDGKTLYFTSQRGAFDHPPFAPMSYAKFVEAIRGPGNGLADIYTLPIEALSSPYRPAP